MRNAAILYAIVSLSSCLLLACGGGGDGGGGGGGGGVKSSIQTQEDADRVAMIIEQQWAECLPIYEAGTHVLAGGTVSGYEGGSAVPWGTVMSGYISGDSYRELVDVTVTYSGYQEDSDFSSLTGSIQADGRLREDDGELDGYSGSWMVTGTVTLSPPSYTDLQGFSFNCTVDFAIQYVTPYDYAAVLRQGGRDWQVIN